MSVLVGLIPSVGKHKSRLNLLGMTVISGGVGAITLASKIMKMNPD